MQRTSKIYFVKSVLHVLHEYFGNFVWINCCRTCKRSFSPVANLLTHVVSFALDKAAEERNCSNPTAKEVELLNGMSFDEWIGWCRQQIHSFVQAKRKKIRERKLWLQNACTSYWHSGMNLPYFCCWTVVICVHERFRSLQPYQWPANILFSHKLFFFANQFCH